VEKIFTSRGSANFSIQILVKTSLADFMTITAEGEDFEPHEITLDDTVIVPIGGGKDSVVTLELIKKTEKVRPFIMNPRGATIECARVAGFGNDGFLEVNRRLDPLLIEMNAQGFLNGHTPFSALLAFYSLLVATISGHRNIALVKRIERQRAHGCRYGSKPSILQVLCVRS
jgi:UDP-N-acetyl-alpha-D-muramoyl-L-alanyl-L-glutamate epimerase